MFFFYFTGRFIGALVQWKKTERKRRKDGGDLLASAAGFAAGQAPGAGPAAGAEQAAGAGAGAVKESPAPGAGRLRV